MISGPCVLTGVKHLSPSHSFPHPRLVPRPCSTEQRAALNFGSFAYQIRRPINTRLLVRWTGLKVTGNYLTKSTTLAPLPVSLSTVRPIFIAHCRAYPCRPPLCRVTFHSVFISNVLLWRALSACYFLKYIYIDIRDILIISDETKS